MISPKKEVKCQRQKIGDLGYERRAHNLSEVEREREKKETELDADCVLQTRLYTCK